MLASDKITSSTTFTRYKYNMHHVIFNDNKNITLVSEYTHTVWCITFSTITGFSV